MNQAIIDQLLVPFVQRFLLFFSLVGVAVGIGLVLNRERMHQIFAITDRWISLRHGTKWLAVPRDIGASVERHRRLVGSVFIVAAMFSTVTLAWRTDGSELAAMLAVPASNQIGNLLANSARGLLISGGILAIAVGIMLLYFPQALRRIEARSDRWYSFRSTNRSGDTMHNGVNRWTEDHPRVTGALITVGALIVAVTNGLQLYVGP